MISLGLLGALGISSAIGALGSGIANAVSGYASQNSANATNIALMREQNVFNAEQAQIQRDWEQEMSNTSYQRAMADMEQAGLNPILAAGNLGGASTPTGSAASGSPAHVGAAKFDLSAVSSALQSMSTLAVVNLAKEARLGEYAQLRKDLALMTRPHVMNRTYTNNMSSTKFYYDKK